MPRYLVMKFFNLMPIKVECFDNSSDMNKFLLFLRGIEQKYQVLAWTGRGYTVIKEWQP